MSSKRPESAFQRIRTSLLAVESILITLFLIQALRYAVSAVYSRVSSASIISLLPADAYDPGMAGVVDPALVQAEIGFLGMMIGLPLLTLFFGSRRWFFIAAVVGAAIGRLFMVTPLPPITPLSSAGLVIGCGLIYVALTVRQRFHLLPVMFILGFGFDQLFRAAANTLDPSLSPNYQSIQTILSAAAVLLAVISFLQNRRAAPVDTGGLMTLWGGLGLGAMLFLQMSFLSMPNVISSRADVDYTLFVPLVMAASLLPLLPVIRVRARSFISIFDSSLRGWIWLLITVLLLITGTRIPGIGGGIGLLLAQVSINLVWWWLARPKSDTERAFTGIWIVVGALLFGLFIVFDLMTYEYAFVRDFAPPLSFLNSFFTPLLRGFRGMGLGVILLAALFAMLPLIQTRRRIPWEGAALMETTASLAAVGVFTAVAAFASLPPVISGVRNVSEIRIGTYNIHGGFNEFFANDLEEIALTIQGSGANVVLLQEVEAGRLTSLGAHQALWLARRLGMDMRFFPTNEGLQGLAVLSKIEIVFDDGELLDSTYYQTGLQRVQIRPDEAGVTLYNTWLNFLLAGEDTQTQESEQRRQLDQIFRIMRAHHPDGELGRAVFGGTFNNVPDSPLITSIQNETPFKDAFAGTNLTNSATLVRSGIGRARFDYLWIWRENLVLTGNGVSDSAASTHRLAFIGVLLRRGE